MLDRVRRRAWGLSGRLIASYILVTLVVVVLVEALVLGFQVPSLADNGQLQAQVDATAQSYGQQLAQRYPGGLPAGTVLGDPGQPGLARPAPDGTLVVPAITGPVHGDQAVTAVVAVAADGTVIASSAPSLYPPGRAAASELPAPATSAMASGATHMTIKHPSVPTPHGSVLWDLVWTTGAGTSKPPASAPGLVAYVYAQAPWSSPGFISPIRAWDELGQLGEDGPLLASSAVLLIAIVPVGVLFALRMIAAGMRRADPGHQPAQAIERISEEALRDMQALLIELRPASPDGAGLGPALAEICAAYHDRLGVTVDADLDDVTVPAPVEHALVRITQEACANAVRHGNARRLTVSLARQDGHVELAVRDTGTGFDPAAPHPGSGLAHIQDRVAELGGTVDIDSAPGRGAALTVRVPVP